MTLARMPKKIVVTAVRSISFVDYFFVRGRRKRLGKHCGMDWVQLGFYLSLWFLYGPKQTNLQSICTLLSP